MGKLNRGLLAGAIGLALAGQANATVVRDSKLANTTNPGVEKGGHRLGPNDRKQVACIQYGNLFAGMNSFVPWGYWSGVPSPRSGRLLMIPLADESTTCVVKREK